MSGTITVSSTTDSQEQVDQAAEYTGDTLPFPQEETPGTSEVEEAETAVESEPAEPSENEEPEEAGEPEEEEPETVEPAPRGKRDREKGLVAQVKRQAAQIAELQEQIRKAVPPPPAEPKPDYSKLPDATDPKYRGKGMEHVMKDVALHAIHEADNEKVDQQRQDAEKKYSQRRDFVIQRYYQMADEAAVKYPDFNEAIQAMGAVPPTIEGTIKQLLNGPEVAYYLAKNPDLFEELKSMDSIDVDEGYSQVIATLHNLGHELRNGSARPPASSPSPRSPQPRPAAPRPLRHVGGASTAATPSVRPDQMSQKDYNAWRDAGGGR